MRVVAEREITNLCVPHLILLLLILLLLVLLFLVLFPLRLLSASLYSSMLLSLPPSLSVPLSIPFPSFRPLSPSYTLRFPRQPAVHPLSFLRSPFLLPFAVPLAALPSLSASFARAFLVFRPLSPCPLSPSVCLASSFPSFIPSRAHHCSLLRPTRLTASFLFPFRFRRVSFSPSILRSPPRSRFSSISVALSLFFTLFLRSALPPVFIPLRCYFQLSLFLSLLSPCQSPGTCARPFHSFPIPLGKLVKKYTF